MQTRLWISALTVILVGLLASVPAMADVSWTGPGWYVEGTETGLFDSTLISGPYPDKPTCESHQPPDDSNYAYFCEYEANG